ncbi:MAG: hypothetical protein WCL02_00990 [bacterium]
MNTNTNKNVIIFYDSELFYIDECINIVKEAGFSVETFISADDLFDRLKLKNDDICLIISELIVEGQGNNFKGRRTDFFANCALYLFDEIDCLSGELSADNTIKDIPKMVFTSWGHAQGGKFFSEIVSDSRVKTALNKSDTSLKEFIDAVRQIVK